MEREIPKLKKMPFNELTKFEQNMLITDNIDYDKIDDPVLANGILSEYQAYVLYDLLFDIQYVIMKRKIEKVLSYIMGNIELSEEELKKWIRNIPKHYSNNDFMLITIDDLKESDKERIAYDSLMLNRLQEKGIKFDKIDLKKLFNVKNRKSLKYIYHYKSCVQNYNLRNQLYELGLEEYKNKVIADICKDNPVHVDALSYMPTVIISKNISGKKRARQIAPKKQ